MSPNHHLSPRLRLKRNPCRNQNNLTQNNYLTQHNCLSWSPLLKLS